MAANRSIRIDQPSMSAFGLHVEWKLLPPSATWYADLDGSRLKFIDSSRHEFTVKLTCDPGEQSCAADGDEITTIVQLASQQGNGLKSEVRVLTRVQSLLSCRHTQVRVEPDSERVDISTPFRVQVFVNDVDSLRVSFTRAEINLVFAGRTIPMQWSRGSNLYVADVPAQLTSQPGLYDLVLNASYAWSETGLAPTCELLRRTITVKEGLSTSWILGGAGTASVVVIGSMVVVVRKRHAHLQAIMVMLFTEVCDPTGALPRLSLH